MTALIVPPRHIENRKNANHPPISEFSFKYSAVIAISDCLIVSCKDDGSIVRSVFSGFDVIGLSTGCTLSSDFA